MSLPPITVPVTDGSGRVSLAWRRAFELMGGGGSSLAMIAASFPHSDLILTGHDAAGTGTITVTNHTRLYPDKQVSVTGATFPTGKPLDTDLLVYYDDPGRAGGAVTYAVVSVGAATNTAFPAYPNGGRHFVGRVRAQTGVANSSGTPAKPPQTNNTI